MFFAKCWKGFLVKISLVCSFCVILLLVFYKVFAAGAFGMGGCCRFYPSCSEYALQVYKRKSFIKATGLVFKRLLNCHPWGPKFIDEPEMDYERL